MRLAVLASGEGTNLQAILDDGLPVVLVVCNRVGAGCVRRAEAAGVPVVVSPHGAWASREAYDEELVRILRERDVDTVALAGFMRILGPALVREFPGRIVNIHPSLLPAFPGLHAIRQALEHGVRVTGVTVHLVDEGVDTGPILAQRAVGVRDDDDEDSLASRIHAVEHGLYPEVLRRLAPGGAGP